jgi:uncharacterized membrane protein YcaP (DUF421 family)
MSASTKTLQGTFSTGRQIRLEHRAQLAGLVALIALVGAALVGVVGHAIDVGRAALVYVFLLLVFRVSGRRTLAQVTTFDLILVLILGDATQQALVGENGTMANALVAVATLVLIDMMLARAKLAWPTVDAVVDGRPVLLVVHGSLQHDAMAREGVTLDDVLTAAREQQGVADLAEVDFAVLEQSGRISIVPRAPGARG